MTITAKYPGTCATCGGAIRVGDSIEWKRGEPSRHAKCPSSRSAKPASKPARKRSSAPRTRRTPGAGEQVIQRRAAGGYTVGATVRLGKVQGGGGPDGHYFVIVSAWLSRANEDFGQYDDMDAAIVRAATDEEAAPVAARIDAAAARKATLEQLVSALRAGERVGDTGQLPPESERELTVQLAKGEDTTVQTIAMTATTIVGRHGGYYDDYRSTTYTVERTEELAALVRALA